MRSRPSRPSALARAAAFLAAALLCACSALAPAPAPAPLVRGPLATRVQHPFGLGFLGMRPRRARTQAPGTLGLALESAYASHFQDGARGGDVALLDGETWHNALRARYGLGERTDVEVELGLLVAWAGFLDGFAEAWHELFGLPNGGREDRPRDAYGMQVVSDGQRAWSLDEERLGLLDLPVVLTQVLAEDPVRGDALALRLGLELPLGSQSRGFGNGALDVGAGLVAEGSRGRWSLFLATDVVQPGGRDDVEDAGLELETLLDAQLGLECRWNDRLSLLGGLVWTSPWTDGLGLEELETSILDLGLGAAYDLGGSRLRASFHEDLATATGADFALAFGWSIGM